MIITTSRRLGSRLALSALMFVASFCLCVRPAAAAVLVDPLDDWSHTSGHSIGLVLDNTNPQNFTGDSSRVKLGYGRTGSFGYHLDDMRAFFGYVYYCKVMGLVQAYASPDGTNWTQVPVSFAAPAPVAGGWFVMAMSGRSLPAGTNYLGFQITSQPELRADLFGPDDVYTPQIGEVDIQYGASGSMPAPTGLTALAAASEVSLSWLPCRSATSYTIKRSSNGTDFTTIADGIRDTNYIDTTAKTGRSYYYSIISVNQDSVSSLSDAVSATPRSGSAIFTDSLLDLGMVISHTSNLTTSMVGAVPTIKRTKPGVESFYYKVAGVTDFAFNVYYSGDIKGQISVEVSPDGGGWTPIVLATSDPVSVAPGMSGTVCSPLNKVPAGTNYVRFDLGSADVIDSDTPQIAQVRMVHSASQTATTVAGLTASFAP